MLVDGRWRTRETTGKLDTRGGDGRFRRAPARFRDWVTPDGAPGPSGRGGFKAEPGRYHLYVSLACPWAHRTLIVRALEGLEGAVSLSVVNPLMGDEGWTFEPADGVIPDTVNGACRLHEIYALADASYTGRVTVPVLWDKARRTIVNNESAEIMRMFDRAFGTEGPELYPEPLRDEIDAVNERVYDTVNNGVYKAGFAATQEAYDEAVSELFATLDWLENRLARRRYLVGERITEADWRLFTTLVRFDAVYHGHFKCNLRRLVDYPNLWAYARELYQLPKVAETVDLVHIKRHYYLSHGWLNPSGIVPKGPIIDWTEPHGRGRKPEAAAG